MTDIEPQGDEQPQGEQGEQATEPDESQGTDWQREARKWEARAKKDKSELDELRKRMTGLISPEQVEDKDRAVTEAQAAAEANALLAAKYRIALEEQLHPDLAMRLLGDTEEALREDAARLKALTPPPAPKVDGKKNSNVPPAETKPDANTLLRMLAKG